MKVFQLKVSGTGITGDEFVYADVVLKADYDALALAAAQALADCPSRVWTLNPRSAAVRDALGSALETIQGRADASAEKIQPIIKFL